MTAAPAHMRPVPGASSVAARTVLIGGLAALGIGAYVSIRPEQPWILLLTTLMVALGTDGLVKSHPHWIDLRPIDSIVYTVLPALAVLGSGLFIDHAIDRGSTPPTRSTRPGTVGRKAGSTTPDVLL